MFDVFCFVLRPMTEMFVGKEKIQRLKRLLAFIAKPEGASGPMVSQIPGKLQSWAFKVVDLSQFSSILRMWSGAAWRRLFRLLAVSLSGWGVLSN